MKKLSLGIVAAAASASFALVSAAVAADMPRMEPPVAAGPVGKLPGKYPVGKYPVAGPAMPVKAPPLIEYYNWSGLYLGFNIGGVWYDVDRVFPLNPIQNFGTSNNDVIYGFHAGVQGQWGNWVLGIETAYSGCARECSSFSGLLTAPGFAADRQGLHKITNLFTVGPRLGYAWDRWMIFATGGAAAADLKSTYCVVSTGVCLNGVPGGTTTNQSGAPQNWGWFVGGGIDWMIHKGTLVDVILGAEYQHFDVRQEVAFRSTPAVCANPAVCDYDLSARGDIARARLTIKTHGWDIFFAPGPAPAVTK